MSNKTRARRLVLLTPIFMYLCCAGPNSRTSAEESKPVFYATPGSLPAAGFSDDYLINLGKAAESFLIAQLANPANKKNLDGIMNRMMHLGGMGNPNPNIARAARAFVDGHCKRRSEGHSIIAPMRTALLIIGARGGPRDVDYLQEWAQSEKFISQLKCAYSNEEKTADTTKYFLREQAVFGLAYNRDPRVLHILESILAQPPAVLFPGRFQGNLAEAIRRNKIVREKGPYGVFTIRDADGLIDKLEKLGH